MAGNKKVNAVQGLRRSRQIDAAVNQMAKGKTTDTSKKFKRRKISRPIRRDNNGR